MTNFLKGAGLLVAGLVIGLLVSSVTGGKALGGVYSQNADYHYQGLYAGTTSQLSISSLGELVTSALATVGTFTQGGGVTATSSAASATVLASSLDTENALEVSLPVGAVTLTLPASTTFPLGTTAGSYRQFTIFNASTTDAAIITIAGNTGTLLEIASSTVSTGLKTIAPSGVAIFTAFRKANSDIEVFMNPGQ